MNEERKDSELAMFVPVLGSQKEHPEGAEDAERSEKFPGTEGA